MSSSPAALAARRAELDRLRPLTPAALRSLEHLYDVELTWTSNAIEGNTLTAAETQLVVEKGITIGGKPLKHHLEALDHFDAIRWVRALAGDPRPLTEADLRVCTASCCSAPRRRSPAATRIRGASC